MMRVDSRSAASRSGNGYVTGRHRTEQRQPRTHRRQPGAREAHGGRAVGGVVREVGEPGAPRLLHAAVELVERLLRDARVGQIRRREVRAQPGEPQRGQIGEARQHGRQLVDRDAEPAHPGVHLDVHVDRAARAARPRRANRSRSPRSYTTGVSRSRDDVVLVPVVVGAEDDDRRPNPRRPQLQPLLDQRHRQRVAQRLERPRHRHGAVPVGVGLDDPEDRRRPARPRLRNRGQVPLDGAEIDLRDRRTDRRADVDFGEGTNVPSAGGPRLWAWLAKPCKVSPAYGAASIN